MQLSGYFIDTPNGKIQVSKGAYLTYLRRKTSTIKNTKTMKKTKSIGRLNYKLTTKKSFKLTDIKSYRRLPYDHDIFCSLPPVLIPMELDNDCDSQWPQINHNVNNLTLSLSLATYDTNHS